MRFSGGTGFAVSCLGLESLITATLGHYRRTRIQNLLIAVNGWRGVRWRNCDCQGLQGNSLLCPELKLAMLMLFGSGQNFAAGYTPHVVENSCSHFGYGFGAVDHAAC